jgi:hypothetical protein
MSLCLLRQDGGKYLEIMLDPTTNKTGDVWHIQLSKLKVGSRWSKGACCFICGGVLRSTPLQSGEVERTAASPLCGDAEQQPQELDMCQDHLMMQDSTVRTCQALVAVGPHLCEKVKGPLKWSGSPLHSFAEVRSNSQKN